MDRFVYIHGFNSGAQSRSGRELERVLGQPVICPQCDYSLPFEKCISGLRQQIVESINANIDCICLMGCSLGGFYALHMRHPAICHIVAWNPVVFPAMQLKDFVGTQTRFTDGEEWEFTDEALYSYAAAPDPRPWLNEVWLEEQRLVQHSWEKEKSSLSLGGVGRAVFSPTEGAGEKGGLSPAEREAHFEPRRDIFLGTRDELINHRLTRAYWQGWANLHSIDSGHQIEDYSHAAELLKKGMLPVRSLRP